MKNFNLKSLATAICLLFSLGVSAYDFTVDGMYFNIVSLEDLTCEITSGDEKYIGDIVIPETVTYNGRTLTVIGINGYCYSHNNYGGAFCECTSLTNVTIPNSVTSIGDYAFYKCSSLASIEIPNSVTSIGESVFSGCSSLTSVEIPNSVTSIGSYAFHNCSGLTSIEIPNSVTSIGLSAFSGCSGLTSVEIPNSVTSIGESAFMYCSSLAGIEIPNSVTEISRSTFEGCSGLTSIDIPNTVTYLRKSAFEGCSGFTSIEIPNSVTSIGEYAFSGCSSLTSMKIPSSVCWIEDYAFSGCFSLKNLIIEGGNDEVINAGYNSYYGFMDYADEGLFFDCPIETLYLGRIFGYDENVRSFSNAFSRITTLVNLTISNSLKKLDSYNNIFYGCTGIKNLIIEDGDEVLEVEDNYSNSDGNTHGMLASSSIERLYIGRNVTRSFWGGITALTSVTIGSMVTDIKDILWSNMKNLETFQSLAMIPPKIGEFTNKQYIDLKIYVPEGSLAAYQAADGWKNFWNIQEGEPTGISSVGVATEQGVKVENGNIVIEDATGLVSVYTVGGTLVKSVKANGRVDIAVPGSGVYIIRVNNKTTKIAL